LFKESIISIKENQKDLTACPELLELDHCPRILLDKNSLNSSERRNALVQTTGASKESTGRVERFKFITSPVSVSWSLCPWCSSLFPSLSLLT
jgi:hypothetical protein